MVNRFEKKKLKLKFKPIYLNILSLVNGSVQSKVPKC